MEKEIEPSVMETYEFEYQDLSTLRAVFAISGQPIFLSNEQIQWFSDQSVLYQQKIAGWDLDFRSVNPITME